MKWLINEIFEAAKSFFQWVGSFFKRGNTNSDPAEENAHSDPAEESALVVCVATSEQEMANKRRLEPRRFIQAVYDNLYAPSPMPSSRLFLSLDRRQQEASRLFFSLQPRQGLLLLKSAMGPEPKPVGEPDGPSKDKGRQFMN